MFVATKKQEDGLPRVSRPNPHEVDASGLTSDEAVTVLVVDDHDAFRRAMRDVVIATEGFAFVGEAASGEAALTAASLLSPKLMLLDQRMPGMGGVEAARRVTERHPAVVVVLVSVEEPDAIVQRACGAAAFVRKHQLCPRLLRALWHDHGSPAQGIETG
jgi:two-component system, NarL family, invasion response regulator UvrY